MPQNCKIEMTDNSRPFFENASTGSPFRLRGVKGWKWSPEQYIEEIPHIARLKLNFLMNCYLSLFNETSGRNDWWRPFSEERKRSYTSVIEACQSHGIAFCFSMHPHLWSDRPLNLEDSDDFEAFFAHFAWAQQRGVRWFSVAMDDVDQCDNGPLHARFCNRFLERLREKDAEAQLLFCPTTYHTGGAKQHPDYIEALCHLMNPDIYLFWTGPKIIPLTITRTDAEEFKALSGHRLILWDNYPVNDAHPTMSLGPITGRAATLPEVCDGYMANSMYPQNQINRIPLYTMAHFAWSPDSYNPDLSIKQAIDFFAASPEQRRALAELVERYPGAISLGSESSGLNPVREGFARLAASEGFREAAPAYVAALQHLLRALQRHFPDEFHDARATLANDVDFLYNEIERHFSGKGEQ